MTKLLSITTYLVATLGLLEAASVSSVICDVSNGIQSVLPFSGDDCGSNSTNSSNSSGSSDFTNTIVDDVVEKVVPSCVFGVESVSFVLFTREHPNGIDVVWNATNIPMKPDAEVRFLIHGFDSDANTTNYYNLAMKWLEKENLNIFSLDWSQAACDGGLTIADYLAYPDALLNTHKVGRLLANFTARLIDNFNVSLNKTIVVGHSLGAHIAGFAGHDIQELGYGQFQQIFGLDPAGPGFETNDPCDRLDKTDASFVVAFHTTIIVGIHRDVGDQDFYFNGAIGQPQCYTISCSHSRAIEYFTDSLDNDCYFIGTSWQWGRANHVPESKCTPEICSVAGLEAILYPARGTFLVLTKWQEPYCTASSVNF